MFITNIIISKTNNLEFSKNLNATTTIFNDKKFVINLMKFFAHQIF